MRNIILLLGAIGFLLAIIIIIVINKPPNKDTKQEILEVNIIIKNHRFIPDIVEVPKNTKLRLIINNQDDTVEEFESNDLHREKIVMPNSSINIILAPLSPGRYDFFGDFHQETAQGALIVN
ncbi:cupredoxin domain-containing protein [Rickettsia endosymbiont of Halotydeus destructor]|uniref:cupredoxin domain-containing protein n=1 Tax=Rickettsia endosymbiont of Halotydeus destructor TaxID=2996754 RepID=UPI003BAF76F4